MFKSRKFQSSIIKPALYSIFKNPSLMISIMSGDFNKMYCKYWQGKLNSREKFIDLVFNENNDDLINKISILNDYILKTKNSTIEAYFIPLYFLVRLIKPEKIVETGVHRGVSSLFILQALHDNNKGKLYSIDLPMSEYKQDNSDMTKSTLPIEKIGTCVPKNLRSRWELIFGDSKEKLPKLLQELSEIDVFLHDSKHTYEHMKWEYETAWGFIKKNGCLISDDTNWSKGAFEKFAKTMNSQNIQLRRDGRTQETFGFILK